MQNTCIGASHVIEGRGVRCRRPVDTFGDRCHDHEGQDPEEAVEALEPDTVLVKGNLNPNWVKRFLQAGTYRSERSPMRERAQDKKGLAQAEELGRSPFAYRGKPDSGTAVLGKNGANNVSIAGILDELEERYGAPAIHILQKTKGPRSRRTAVKNTLVLSFNRDSDEEPASEEILQLARKFFGANSWGFTHIWANPYSDEGEILHTVNLGRRQPDQEPEGEVQFAEGLWKIS